MDQNKLNQQRFARLLQAMSATDVPTARPNFTRQDETTGLTLLSLALRLNHVNRVTESLRLINIDHLSRTVNLDIDLRNITEQQRQSLAVHEMQAEHVIQGSKESSRRLWIPISRHSREDLAPVVVRDASGSVVPRLTQIAATNAIIAGVTWLFRVHFKSSDVVGDDYDRNQQARWLIEVAIARMIEHGAHGIRPHSRVNGLSTTVHGIAEKHIAELDVSMSNHLADLLLAASQEYFLIVMLPESQSHQFLTYEAPLIPAVRSSTARRRAWRSLLPVSTEFTVNYVTQLPRTVSSYHVTVDVPEEIDVRRFILSSDADQAAVQDLASRIDALVAFGEKPHIVDSAAYEAEQQEVESALGVLGQRRELDMHGFDYYLRNRELIDDRRFRRGSLKTSGVGALARLLGARSEEAQRDRQLPTRTLSEQARRLRHYQFGLDVSTDNDPRENGAHAQWRPVPLDFGHPTLEPVEARVYLAMADEPPALVESVAWMIAALLVVVLGLDVISKPLRLQTNELQADAVVAVLLIVPGILLSRLDIPATHSVLGRLRRFPRTVAYLSVAFTTALAMTVAVADKIPSYAFNTCAMSLFVLLLLCFVEIFSRSLRRQVLVPASATLPPWLRNEFAPPAHLQHWATKLMFNRRRTHPPDVYFDAIRPVPNTTRVASKLYERRAAQRLRTTADETPVTTEGPALLAELGSRALAAGYSEVWAEIAQFGADTNGSPALLPTASSDNPHPDDLLFTCNDGVVCQITSGYSKLGTSAWFPPTSPATSPPQGCLAAPWKHYAPFKPTAIRQNMHDVDFLVEFEGEARASADRRMLEVLHEALTLVEQIPALVVPTLVLAPAAAPSRSERALRPPAASGSTARITFTLPHTDHAGRLALQDQMISLAHKKGVTLWRASRRPGSGHGDWQRVYDARGTSPRNDNARLETDASLVALTFIGTRGESSVASFRLLAEALTLLGADVASLAATVVTQFAVVQLVLRGNSKEHLARQATAGRYRVDQAFAELVNSGFLKDIGPDVDFKHIVFAAYITHLEHSSKKLEGPANSKRALWVDWEIPADTVRVQTLAEYVLSACMVVGIKNPEIVYWRSSRSTSDTIRGRAKLAVELPPRGDKNDSQYLSYIGEKAKALQSSVIARLTGSARSGIAHYGNVFASESHVGKMPDDASVASLSRHDVFLHVVWSESWLKRRRGV